MPDDLTARVKADIAKTGFPLELRTAEALREFGWEASHSFSYLDPDKAIGREVDLFAGRRLTPDGIYGKDTTRSTSVNLLVECKKSEKPWVAFVGKPRNPLSIEWASWRAGEFPLDQANSYYSETLRFLNKSYRQQTQFVGFSGSEAFKHDQAHKDEGANRFYEALITVLKATTTLTSGPNHSFNGYALNFPIVVVDAPLFQARLENGELIVEPVPDATMFVKHHSPAYGSGPVSVLVDVVTETAWKDFLRNRVNPIFEALEVVYSRNPGLIRSKTAPFSLQPLK